MYREEIQIEILNNKVNLDFECWNCKGGTEKPKEPFVDENGVCERCNGTGYELSENGRSILNLIKRHLKGDKNV